MKLCARKALKSRLVEVTEGAVKGIVKIDIGGGNVITSSITNNAIKELGLKEGSEAYTVIKVSNVMVGLDE